MDVDDDEDDDCPRELLTSIVRPRERRELKCLLNAHAWQHVVIVSIKSCSRVVCLCGYTNNTATYNSEDAHTHARTRRLIQKGYARTILHNVRVSICTPTSLKRTYTYHNSMPGQDNTVHHLGAIHGSRQDAHTHTYTHNLEQNTLTQTHTHTLCSHLVIPTERGPDR